MFRINNRQWHELSNSDIEVFLKSSLGETDNDENFYYEFKDAKVDNKKIANEISAFANTYGGFIFIGISDEKDIVGSGNWTEERIQNLVCDSISPLPSYDVRKFEVDGKTIIIIKVDEGSRPPYITNRGEIYERISSGCRKLVSSERLTAIYERKQKRQENLNEKLKLEVIKLDDSNGESNVVAAIDIGFDIVTNDSFCLSEDFFDLNPKEIETKFEGDGISSVYRVGNAIVISYGKMTQKSGRTEKDTMLPAGISDFMVIYTDGAVKMRCILCAQEDGKTYIDDIVYSLAAYQKVYEYLVPDLVEKFVYVSKYEQLHVMKSFRPEVTEKISSCFEKNELSSGHIIYTGGRVPSYGYRQFDKNDFKKAGIEFNTKNLLDELFKTYYSFMGMI